MDIKDVRSSSSSKKRCSKSNRSKMIKNLKAAGAAAREMKRENKELKFSSILPNDLDLVNEIIPYEEISIGDCEDFHCSGDVLRTYSKAKKPEILDVGSLGDTMTEELPPLNVERSDEIATSYIPSGKRIVDIAYFMKQMEEVLRHPSICTGGKLILQREVKDGLISKFHFECQFCEKTATVFSDSLESNINTSFVWGALNIGIGYSQGEELCGTMDIPFMCQGSFRRHEKKVTASWKSRLSEQMEKNILIEKQLAHDNNEVDEGHPYITVIVDGGWSKRSYGHSFSSKSGVACIIGKRTGKIIYLDVKNKYCQVCASTPDIGVISSHICNKNYSGPSTGMEQTVIVEGLKYIFDKYKVWVKFLIGDGDSSVFARVRERAPYGYKIQKLECANHIVKCYTSKLYTMASNTAKYDCHSRSLLRREVKRLKNAARCAIKTSKGDVQQLRADLKNGPYHVFGSHSNCRPDYCKTKVSEINHIAYLEKTPLLRDIRSHLDAIVRKADRLTSNVTTNSAESYMALVSKFTGGKRVDFSKGKSYESRCYGAGIVHMMGSNHILNLHKDITGKSPGQSTKKIVMKRLERANSFKARRLNFTRYKRAARIISEPDCEYGPNAAEPDVSPTELQETMDNILESLQADAISDEKCMQLQLATVGQVDNPQWIEARQKRLTASKFGIIYKMRDSTLRHNTVKNLILKREIVTKEIIYGRQNEQTAINLYEQINSVNVVRCGLFIRKDFSFLAASPDGLVGDNGLIEVKCLPSIGKKTIYDAALEDNICVNIVDCKLHLKKTHNYWFQIQGQLYIAKKDFCDLIIYADSGLEIIRLYPDPDFELTVIPRLSFFYRYAFLPELADSRIQRGMKIREPARYVDMPVVI